MILRKFTQNDTKSSKSAQTHGKSCQHERQGYVLLGGVGKLNNFAGLNRVQWHLQLAAPHPIL